MKSMGTSNQAEREVPKAWYTAHKKGLVITGSILLIILVVLAYGIFNVLTGSFGLNYARESSPSIPSIGESGSYFAQDKVYRGADDDGGAASTDRKIIKNASLNLVVSKAEEAITVIKEIARVHNGFVSNANLREVGDDKKAGTITIRVPADSFDSAVSSVKELAIKVTHETITTQDVTEEFVDLEARLTTMKAQEEQFRDLLDRADTVEDILKVRQELDRVRIEIERLEGRLTYLSRQVDMATITVSLVSEADVEIFGIVWSPLVEVKQGVRDMFESLVSFVNILIAFLFRLPAILLWVGTLILIFYLGWKGVKLILGRIRW